MAQDLEERYATSRREGELLAGAPGDVAQRATVYHRVFRHSGGNHVFPLLAAHGALWGKGYFARGMVVGLAFSCLDLHRSTLRRDRLRALAAFAETFRDINRRVCVEVSASYRFTAECGEMAGADQHIDPMLLEALNSCHRARRRGRSFGRAERAALFDGFFRWEQREVVGPAVASAVSAFTWNRVRALALRPTIRFAYIPRRDALRFTDFGDVNERIEKGLRAYEIAEEVGLAAVEATLVDYRVPPTSFADDAALLSVGLHQDGLGHHALQIR